MRYVYGRSILSSYRSMSSPSPSRKRKWGEIGEQIVCAAAGGIADGAVSAVVGSYGELRSFDEQLERLEWLAMEVSATAAEAERVGGNARSWPLRRWLRSLRDAASEGRAVARTLRRRRRAAAGGGSGGSGGDALWLAVVRDAKKALLGDGDMARLRRTTRKLETAAAGMGTFLKLLELELAGRPWQPALTSAPPAAQEPGASTGGGLSPGRGATARRCKRTKTKRKESLEWREEAGALHAETTTATATARRSPAYAPSPDRHNAGRLRGLVLRVHTAAATAYVITARCGFGGVFLEAFQE
ncbi:hypothetical protein ACP4OV_012051 [Aristida adscensionis]